MSMRSINSSGQNIKSSILDFRVASVTCWLVNNMVAKLSKGPDVGQLGLGHCQFILGILKSPNIIIRGRGEGNDNVNSLIIDMISSKSA